MDRNPFHLPSGRPTNDLSQRPSIFDGVLNVNTNVANMGGVDQAVQPMPWHTSGAKMPNVVKFTGDEAVISTSFNNPVPHSSGVWPSTSSYSKRKSADTYPRPSKILITEELMVEKMKDMKIHNEIKEHNSNFGDVMDTKETLPKLTICEEIKNMPTVFDPVIPKKMWDVRERPTRALVLWKPPPGFCGRHILRNAKVKYPEKENQKVGDESDSPMED